MTGFDAHIDSFSGQPSPTTAAVPNDARPTRLAIATFARVTPERAALSRMIGRGCHVELATLGADATLALLRTEDESADWSSPIGLQGSFGTIVLAQGARLLRALGGVDLSREQDADDERWSWLQAALVARLQGTPLAGVERLVRLAKPQDPDAVTLSLVLRTGQHAVPAPACASAQVWLAFLGQSTWARTKQPLSAIASLPVDIPVRIARHALPAHALQSLSAGDVILPHSPAFSCDGTGMVRIGRLGVKVQFQAPGMLEIIQLEGSMDMDDHDVDQPGDADEAIASSAAAEGEGISSDLDSLPVTLDFSLGIARLSLGELRSLDTGAILSVEGGSPASVAILSGGRVLGRGEAVNVDGQLGIRVTQWGSV